MSEENSLDEGWNEVLRGPRMSDQTGKIIFKYQMPVLERFTMTLPAGAQIIRMEDQEGPDMTETPVVLDPDAIALVLQQSVITFGGVEQTRLGPKAASVIRGLQGELQALKNAAQLSRPPVAGDGGEALEHLTNVLFADPGPKLAAAHKAARLWWNAQDGLEAPPPPTPEPAEVTEEDEALACEIADAANIVSHDGYYEMDTDAVAAVLARHRLKFSAARRDEVFRIYNARFR